MKARIASFPFPVFSMILFVFSGSCFAASKPSPPDIRSLVKPKVLKKVLGDRMIMTSATLDDVKAKAAGKGMKKYSYRAAMWVDAPLDQTRRALTDYSLYPKMISYIDEAKYTPAKHLLSLKGGIWRYRLTSVLRFEQRSPNWIHYVIIAGNFRGLIGDIFFQAAPEKGTLVYLRGALSGKHWPPAFIIENGAEIVFEFTAQRMRSYIEGLRSERKGISSKGEQNDREVPKPRSHI